MAPIPTTKVGAGTPLPWNRTRTTATRLTAPTATSTKSRTAVAGSSAVACALASAGLLDQSARHVHVTKTADVTAQALSAPTAAPDSTLTRMPERTPTARETARWR